MSEHTTPRPEPTGKGSAASTGADPAPAGGGGSAVATRDRDVLVDVRGVKVHFPIKRGLIFDRTVGHVYAVDGMDLQIRRGETYGLVGESGCGKSTFGRALLQLEDLTEGEVHFDGIDLAGLKGEKLRRHRKHMQMVFQDPLGSLDPRQTVEQLLLEGMRAHGLVKGQDATTRLSDLLQAVGLPRSALKKYPHEFSGGQRQRVGIARALALEPKVLVADEPTSALDVSVQARVLELLQELQQDAGFAALFISHDLAVVELLSDRIAVMNKGRLVEVGHSGQVVNDPQHPYTQRLIAAVPVPNPKEQAERRKRRDAILEAYASAGGTDAAYDPASASTAAGDAGKPGDAADARDDAVRRAEERDSAAALDRLEHEGHDAQDPGSSERKH